MFGIFKSKLLPSYTVMVDDVCTHWGLTLKKADAMYNLEVEFNKLFVNEYIKTIRLIKTVGNTKHYIKVKSYD